MTDSPTGRLSAGATGVEDPDTGAGDAGEPGRRLLGHEGLDVVPVPQLQPELGEQVEAAAAGEETGADAVVEQGLAFERSAADAFVAGEHYEPGLSAIGSHTVSAAPVGTGQPGAPGQLMSLRT